MAVQQLVVFSMGDKEYGMDISKISSIEDGLMSVYKIPGTPAYIEGIINLRDRVHAVVNLRKRLKLDAKSIDENTRVIMAKTESDTCGIIVDEVKEIKSFEDSGIETEQGSPADDESKFISGIRTSDGRTIFILDPELLLAV